MTAPLVLIADNDTAVSSLLVEILKRSGMRTVCAFDGVAAARLARDPAVDVLVCDLDMPKQSGGEVLASLAEVPSPPPTVVVSGFVDDATAQRLDQFEFVRAVMRKPFDLFEFAGVVRDLAQPGGTTPSEGVATQL